MSKEKTTDRDLCRHYGIPEEDFINLLKNPRWKSNLRKSILWYYASKFTRIRDWRKYGKCISCGVKIEHWKDGQAGHYAPASSCGIDLLFDGMNVNMECARCNAFDEGHLFGYRRGLIERYGLQDTVMIENRYLHNQQHPEESKEYSQHQYDQYITELRALMLNEGMIADSNIPMIQ